MVSTTMYSYIALMLVFLCSTISCHPLNLAIVHGKRSVNPDPNLKITDYGDPMALGMLPGYLDSGYEIIEDDSSFRRNEPEVPTKVAHMFGRTLDDNDLSGALYDLDDVRDLRNYVQAPSGIDELQRIKVNPEISKSRRRTSQSKRNPKIPYPVKGLPEKDVYRYLAELFNTGVNFDVDGNETGRTF